MTQKWLEHPDIRNDQGQPLTWPEGFLPVPKSLEVAFLAARFHQETGDDTTPTNVSELALLVARTHFEAVDKSQDEALRGMELKKGLEALGVAVEIRQSKSRLDRTIRTTRERDLF